MINKLAFNYRLNELKDKNPQSTTLIEAIQVEFNKTIELISPTTRRALLQFPMQFIQRIPTSHGEWTTQLHVWADNQLEDLLRIDPIILTAKNSNGDTVLHNLVHAAIGKFTQQVNYDLVEKILTTDLNYTELETPGDPDSAVPGNAWYETDLEGNTPMEYLYNRAASDGEYKDAEPDNQLMALIDRYAEMALDTNDDVEPPPVDTFDEEAAQEDIVENEAERDQSLETDPREIETADEESGEEINTDENTGVVNSPEPKNTESHEEIGVPGNDDSKNVLNIISTLLKLGRSLG